MPGESNLLNKAYLIFLRGRRCLPLDCTPVSWQPETNPRLAQQRRQLSLVESSPYHDPGYPDWPKMVVRLRRLAGSWWKRRQNREKPFPSVEERPDEIQRAFHVRSEEELNWWSYMVLCCYPPTPKYLHSGSTFDMLFIHSVVHHACQCHVLQGGRERDAYQFH